jgi:ornithine carbamoyltransferase
MSIAIGTGNNDNQPRHFLDLALIEAPVLRRILDQAARFKRAGRAAARPRARRARAGIFVKTSTRAPGRFCGL